MRRTRLPHAAAGSASSLQMTAVAIERQVVRHFKCLAGLGFRFFHCCCVDWGEHHQHHSTCRSPAIIRARGNPRVVIKGGLLGRGLQRLGACFAAPPRRQAAHPPHPPPPPSPKKIRKKKRMRLRGAKKPLSPGFLLLSASFLLRLVGASSSPAISVGLKASWTSPPFVLELLSAQSP